MILWTRITVTGFCWLWNGTIDRDGYGRFVTRHRNLPKLAHRRVYEELVGPIGREMELDHLCRLRACVNPDHLEPVTHAENSRRTRGRRDIASHCRHGHAFTPDNTRPRADGQGRTCKTCDRAAVARYKARKEISA